MNKIEGKKTPYADPWDREVYEEAVGILNGSVYYNPSDSSIQSRDGKTTIAAKKIYVRDNLGYKILMALCVPTAEGINSEQNMGRNPLIPYLYERSEWIGNIFTGAKELRGGELEIDVGDSAPQLFSKSDLRIFDAELAKVPVPEDPLLRKECNNLRSLVRLALEDADLTLLRTLL